MNKSVLLGSLPIVLVISACGLFQAQIPATAGVEVAATQAAPQVTAPAPTLTPRPTSIASPTPTPDPCVSWEEVEASMTGQVVCVRGLITDLKQSRQVGTRYQFSTKSGTFVLYSAYLEIINPSTGKTIGPGTCVEVTGKLEMQSGVPFINIDKLTGQSAGEEIQGFSFYNDPGACE